MQSRLRVEQLILPELPGRRARGLGGDERDDIARAEVPSAVFLTAKANPRFQLGVEVVLACGRQQPVVVACPLEALGVEGEGALI